MGRRLKDRDYTADLSALGRIGKRMSRDDEIPRADRDRAVKAIQTAAQVLARMIGKETGENGKGPSKEEGELEEDASDEENENEEERPTLPEVGTEK